MSATESSTAVDSAAPPAGLAAEAVLDEVARELTRRPLPGATYRVQFHQHFTFRDARSRVPYLAELGVSHCYASPYLKARAGSTHGYDILNHNSLNPEIGTPQEYDEFVHALHARGMGQIVDVVPNHMGIASNDNEWWNDVLENGPSSPYASFFDIDWMPLKPDLAHKVLLPVLGDQFGRALEDQQLRLVFGDGGFWIEYYDRRFPIAPRSWTLLLAHRRDELERRLGGDHPHLPEYQSIVTALEHLPPRTETDSEKVSVARREKEVARRRLAELCRAEPRVAEFLQENVRICNGSRGDPRSFDLLEQLLEEQAYRLSYWRVAADEINYRRFFDINDLVALCMENPEVFEQTHGFILRLVDEGKVDGLRIDHPDGLYDPADYLMRLQRARLLALCHARARDWFGALADATGPRDAAAPSAARMNGAPAWDAIERELADRYQAICRDNPTSPVARPLYVVVEKILGPGEPLPENWPVHGTTGYDFMNDVNGIFVDCTQARAFQRLYTRFTRMQADWKELVYQCKKLILQVSMSSELTVLGHELDRLSERNRWSRDFTLSSLTDAIREIIACFPVYRTYNSAAGMLERDRAYIETAVRRAKRRNPSFSSAIFDFLRSTLLLEYSEEADEATRAAQQRFVGKFQQVTGPVMAKAVEDTAFYVYNRLVSLNEVGSDPEQFGHTVEVFHRKNLERQARWPHSLLATSTHDNKRSEDVRARLNVLSEIPQEWKDQISRWTRWNRRARSELEGEPAPTRNDEYLLYQTLVGTWPFQPMGEAERAAYHERIQQYMLKAIREAKANTSWVSPHDPYEAAMRRFVSGVLENAAFLAGFQPFAQAVAEAGIWNALAQTLLRLTCPGVPDTYQGTELWDFSLVDPDNRRPVDYELRARLLRELGETARATAAGDRAADLVEKRRDGRIKLSVIVTALEYRRDHPGLFTTGAYLPLEAAGAKREHVCAFARIRGGAPPIIIVVPRLVVRLAGLAGGPPLGERVWADSTLILPPAQGGQALRNLFTDERVMPVTTAAGHALPVSSVLSAFPVAMLVPAE